VTKAGKEIVTTEGENMKFASTRLVAADINSMVAFYELVTCTRADWLAPVFAEIVTPGAALAIGSAETVALFKEGSAETGANRTAILEFMVSDVDAEFARLKDQVEVVHTPKDLPWGNRTVQFRDPEGTCVALYTPVTEAARRRFSGR
jgi:predicted enzyme related to lactoylglutathione lyase